MKKFLIILILTSCTSKKSIQKSCILKDVKYKSFVEYHKLNEDVDEFLKNR